MQTVRETVRVIVLLLNRTLSTLSFLVLLLTLSVLTSLASVRMTCLILSARLELSAVMNSNFLLQGVSTPRYLVRADPV